MITGGVAVANNNNNNNNAGVHGLKVTLARHTQVVKLLARLIGVDADSSKTILPLNGCPVVEGHGLQPIDAHACALCCL